MSNCQNCGYATGEPDAELCQKCAWAEEFKTECAQCDADLLLPGAVLATFEGQDKPVVAKIGTDGYAEFPGTTTQIREGLAMISIRCSACGHECETWL